LSSLINVEKGKFLDRKFFKIDRLPNRVAKTAVILLARYPALAVARLTQWTYLHTWIHDWGEASKVYWNEVIAPAMLGENAKLAQVEV